MTDKSWINTNIGRLDYEPGHSVAIGKGAVAPGDIGPGATGEGVRWLTGPYADSPAKARRWWNRWRK